MSIGSFSNIISQLDSPTSLAPIFAKDMVDNVGRTTMAYNQGGRHEARERFIEEFTTSALWIGGIPFFRKVFDYLVFKPMGIDPDVHLKKIELSLKDKKALQAIKESDVFYSKFLKKTITGADILEKASKYKSMNLVKTVTATLLPLFLLVKVLPKLNQGLTKQIILGEEAKNYQPKKYKHRANLDNKSQAIFSGFINQNSKLDKKSQAIFAGFNQSNNVSFKGIGSFLNNSFNFYNMAQAAQVDPVANMLCLDVGISGGRLLNARNNDERAEIFVREAGIIGFFYIFSNIIRAGFNKLAEKMNIPIDLDAKVLMSKDFAQKATDAVKDEVKSAELLKFNAKNEEELINLIQDELKAGRYTVEAKKNKAVFVGFENATLDAAYKAKKINIIEKMEKAGEQLKHAVDADGKHMFELDLKKMVNFDAVKKQNEILTNFIKKAKDQDVVKFLKKAKIAKPAFVLANLAICSFSLAYILPKVQYAFRHKRTGGSEFPGIRELEAEAQKLNKQKKAA